MFYALLFFPLEMAASQRSERSEPPPLVDKRHVHAIRNTVFCMLLFFNIVYYSIFHSLAIPHIVYPSLSSFSLVVVATCPRSHSLSLSVSVSVSIAAVDDMRCGLECDFQFSLSA